MGSYITHLISEENSIFSRVYIWLQNTSREDADFTLLSMNSLISSPLLLEVFFRLYPDVLNRSVFLIVM